MNKILTYLLICICLGIFFSSKAISATTAEEVLNKDCKKIDYPKSLADACVKGSNGLRPVDEWQKFSKLSGYAVWSYSFKGNKWAYSWSEKFLSMESAITESLYDCNLEKLNWTDAEALCVPFYIKEKNKKARETTDQERIDMMVEHYGQEKTVNFFSNNRHNWAYNDYQILVDNSLILCPYWRSL